MSKSTRIELEAAQSLLLDHTKPIKRSEAIPLLEVVGRIAAEPITARYAHPPFDRSPYDGYALRSADTVGASTTASVRLTLVGKITAGDAPDFTLAPGQAAQVTTGAMLPPGADCVLMQEKTLALDQEVLIFSELAPHQNFCFRGEDVSPGQSIINLGQKLNYAHAGLLAMQGFNTCNVYAKPQVAVLASGDELIMPNNVLGPGKIFNSNSFMLGARLNELGAMPAALTCCGDNLPALAQSLQSLCAKNDLVITTGGVSVGFKDLLPKAATQIGAEILFHGVNIKPGSPVMAAFYQDTLLLCLSGNPFAAAATFEVLAKPVLAKLSGSNDWHIIRQKAVLQTAFAKASPTRRLIRALLKDGLVAIPAAQNGSGALASLAACNCLIDVPAGTQELKSGQAIEVILL